jgi:hypothetical protein
MNIIHTPAQLMVTTVRPGFPAASLSALARGMDTAAEVSTVAGVSTAAVVLEAGSQIVASDAAVSAAVSAAGQ